MKTCGETSMPKRGETDHKLTKLSFYFRSNTSNKITKIKYELNELKVITQFLSTSYSMIIIAMKIHKKKRKQNERKAKNKTFCKLLSLSPRSLVRKKLFLCSSFIFM